MVVPLRGVVILVFVDGALGNIGDCFAFSQPTCNMCESSHCMAEGIVLGRAKTIPDNGLLLQQPPSNQYPRFALKAFCNDNGKRRLTFLKMLVLVHDRKMFGSEPELRGALNLG